MVENKGLIKRRGRRGGVELHHQRRPPAATRSTRRPGTSTTRPTRHRRRRVLLRPRWRSRPGGVDMSSTILSRPVDVERFGLIFAGAQKNMGPAGLCVVIVRDDLVGHACATADLRLRADGRQRLRCSTPPTFSVYLLGLILEWVQSLGGWRRWPNRRRRRGSTPSSTPLGVPLQPRRPGFAVLDERPVRHRQAGGGLRRSWPRRPPPG